MNKTSFYYIAVLIFTFFVSYAQDGVLDASFGQGGKLYLNFNGYSESEMGTVLTQPDNKIIASGVRHNHGANQQIFILRFNNDGSPDATFGNNGLIETNFSETPSLVTALLQPNNKIIAVGSINYNSQAFLLRYNANGSPDASFGNNGKVIIEGKRFTAAFLQSDGKLVASTVNWVNSISYAQLIRFNTDGTLDNSFGINGVISTESVASGLRIKEIKSVSNGRLVFIGEFGTGYEKDVVIAKFWNNGVLDTSFGNNGFIIVNQDAVDFCSSLKILDNDKILFYLFSYHTQNNETVATKRLVRLLSNGAYDADFATNGNLFLEENIFPLEIQVDGKILVGGGYDSGIYDNPVFIGMTRYLANGTLDTTFGTNGVVMTSAGNYTRASPTSFAIQSDGKIVVGATYSEAYLSSHPNTLLLRYNSQLLGQSSNSLVEKGFVVYPNPILENSVTVDFNLNEAEDLSLDLYDLQGKLLERLINKQSFGSGSNQLKINLPNTMSGGMYFLKLDSRGGTQVFKILK